MVQVVTVGRFDNMDTATIYLPELFFDLPAMNNLQTADFTHNYLIMSTEPPVQIQISQDYVTPLSVDKVIDLLISLMPDDMGPINNPFRLLSLKDYANGRHISESVFQKKSFIDGSEKNALDAYCSAMSKDEPVYALKVARESGLEEPLMFLTQLAAIRHFVYIGDHGNPQAACQIANKSRLFTPNGNYWEFLDKNPNGTIPFWNRLIFGDPKEYRPEPKGFFLRLLSGDIFTGKDEATDYDTQFKDGFGEWREYFDEIGTRFPHRLAAYRQEKEDNEIRNTLSGYAHMFYDGSLIDFFSKMEEQLEYLRSPAALAEYSMKPMMLTLTGTWSGLDFIREETEKLEKVLKLGIDGIVKYLK
jgi:hypothetical protein